MSPNTTVFLIWSLHGRGRHPHFTGENTKAQRKHITCTRLYIVEHGGGRIQTYIRRSLALLSRADPCILVRSSPGVRLTGEAGKSLCAKLVFSGSVDFSSPVSPLPPITANSRTDSAQKALASHSHLGAHHYGLEITTEGSDDIIHWGEGQASQSPPPLRSTLGISRI